jgi:hypothetical protein
VLPLEGDGERRPVPVVATSFIDGEPQFSPDGRWIAYVSDETGRNEVYVQSFPTSAMKWRLSNRGGQQPMWRKDGRELFFVSDDRKFYAVDIHAGASFEYGTPHLLFSMRADVARARNSYVPSADGQRFLVNMLVASTSPITVVTNWTADHRN